MKETKLFELVTGTEMKPWLLRNMLTITNTCENGWSNFLANFRVVSLKLLKLTQFAWPNLSIYFNFLCAVPCDYVIESARFLMRPPVNHSTMVYIELCILYRQNVTKWKLFVHILSIYLPLRSEYELQYGNVDTGIAFLCYYQVFIYIYYIKL